MEFLTLVTMDVYCKMKDCPFILFESSTDSAQRENTVNITSNSIRAGSFIACIYEKNWWVVEVFEVEER